MLASFDRRSQCQAPGPLPSKWSSSERSSGAEEFSTPHETFASTRGTPRGENEEEGLHAGDMLSLSCAGVVNAASVQSPVYPNAVQSVSAHPPGSVPDYSTSHQPGPDAGEQNFSPAGKEVTERLPVVQPFTPSNILEWQTPPGKILRTITPGVSPALQPLGSPTDSLLSAHSSSLSGLSLGPSARQASSSSTSTKMSLKRPQQALHKFQTVPMQHSHTVKVAVQMLQGQILDQDVISVSGRVESGEVSTVDELSGSPERSIAGMCAESGRLSIAGALFESGGLCSVVESEDLSIVGGNVDGGILSTGRQETGGGDVTGERPSSIGGEDSQKRKREPSAELSGERPVSRQIQKYPEAE